MLASTGRVIRESIRKYDLAGRFGGEEFSIALPEVGPKEAALFAERLRTALENTRVEVRTSAMPIQVTMSVGVASFPGDGRSLADLIHQADVAVYQAKIKGRNQSVSAHDVPDAIKQGTTITGDRLESHHAGQFTPRPELAAEGEA